MKKDYFKKILKSNKNLKLAYDEFFKCQKKFETWEEQLKIFLKDEKLIKQAEDYMSDSSRGYNYKWNSYRRRWNVGIMGSASMKNVMELLVEKKNDSVWSSRGGGYGKKLTSYVKKYEELTDDRPDDGERLLATEVSKLPEYQRLLFAKFLHDQKICRIGCEGFGHYKSPTTCGNCHIAKQRISWFGLDGFIEFCGSRNYRVESIKIQEAEDVLNGKSTKQTFEMFVKKQISLFLKNHRKSNATMPSYVRTMGVGLQGQMPAGFGGDGGLVSYDDPIVYDSWIDCKKKIAVVIIKAQIDHMAGRGQQYEWVVYKITPRGHEQIDRKCAYNIENKQIKSAKSYYL